MKNVIWWSAVCFAILGSSVAKAGHESHGDGELSIYSHMRLATEVAGTILASRDTFPFSEELHDRLIQDWRECKYRQKANDGEMATVVTGRGVCRVFVNHTAWMAQRSKEGRWRAMCGALLSEETDLNSAKICLDIWARNYHNFTTWF